MKRAIAGMAVGLVLLGGLVVRTTFKLQSHSSAGDASVAAPPAKNVLILGASVAEGWDDKKAGGYLIRAFQTLSKQDHVNYQVVNKAKAGNGCVQIIKQYPVWLKTYRPDIVVISWGALDDLYEGTPLATVQAQVTWETRLALADHATVLVVTPPITPASYVGKLAAREPGYVAHEIAGAKAVKDPNVYVFDVFHQMTNYVAAHHQSYKLYAGDGWHPNTAGHILAAELLVGDVQKTFNNHPISVK